jgi:hypothetical protein
MRRRLLSVSALVLALAAFVPAGLAGSATETYEVHLEVPNVAEAPNGDRVSVEGMGEYSVHPKSIEAEGTFEHTSPSGALVAEGTWEATQLLEYQSYGCGVVLGEEIEPEACGGVLKLRVLLTVTAPSQIAGFQTEGILTVFCIIGPNPPNSHDDPTEEGIHLLVPGIIHFNRIVSGMNVYIRTG